MKSREFGGGFGVNVPGVRHLERTLGISDTWNIGHLELLPLGTTTWNFGHSEFLSSGSISYGTKYFAISFQVPYTRKLSTIK